MGNPAPAVGQLTMPGRVWQDDLQKNHFLGFSGNPYFHHIRYSITLLLIILPEIIAFRSRPTSSTDSPDRPRSPPVPDRRAR